MAKVLPFRALRYASLDDATRRLLPDMPSTSDAERKRLALSDPLHVARLYEAPDPWAQLLRWESQGHLVAEDPAMYLVETQAADRLLRQPPVRFLLCAMSADPEVTEIERTPGRIGTAAVEPVPVLAADDQQVFRTLLADVVADNFPVWEAHVEGSRVRLWRIGSGAMQRRIRATLEEMPVRPHGPVPEAGTFLAAMVPLSDPGLRMVPYHRGLKGLGTFNPERFLALVSDYARIYELERPLDSHGGMEEARERLAQLATGQRAVMLVLPEGQGKLLRFRMGLELDHIPAAPKNPTLRSLDLALLNSLVLRTVLGIREPDAARHPNVFPVAGLGHLVSRVNEGVFQAGFALNPPPVWEVRAVMEAAQALPPRTMRLQPTPPAGLLFLDPRAATG